MLVAFLCGGTLRRLARQWLDDPNYSHRLFVPSTGMLFWMGRKRWMQSPVRPSLAVLSIIAIAAVMRVIGRLGRNSSCCARRLSC